MANLSPQQQVQQLQQCIEDCRSVVKDLQNLAQSAMPGQGLHGQTGMTGQTGMAGMTGMQSQTGMHGQTGMHSQNASQIELMSTLKESIHHLEMCIHECDFASKAIP